MTFSTTLRVFSHIIFYTTDKSLHVQKSYQGIEFPQLEKFPGILRESLSVVFLGILPVMTPGSISGLLMVVITGSIPGILPRVPAGSITGILSGVTAGSIPGNFTGSDYR